MPSNEPIPGGSQQSLDIFTLNLRAKRLGLLSHVFPLGLLDALCLVVRPKALMPSLVSGHPLLHRHCRNQPFGYRDSYRLMTHAAEFKKAEAPHEHDKTLLHANA